MTCKAFCGPDGTSYCLIVNDLQVVTATRFFIRATVFGVSGFVGLIGLEIPFGPFFECSNGKVSASSPAIKSHFRIYLVDHFTHIPCMNTEEAITSIHDEIEDEGFIVAAPNKIKLRSNHPGASVKNGDCILKPSEWGCSYMHLDRIMLHNNFTLGIFDIFANPFL